MSRPAVESTLFRARKRLGEEYDELASGARCQRIQQIISAGDARLGLRDQRKLARHLSHCQPCRRLAARDGLDVPVPVRRRIAEKIAGLLPLPGFLRFRGSDDATSLGGSSWMVHMPSFADSMSSGWSKGAAGLAALLLAGAGASTFAGAEKRDERGTGYRVTDARTAGDGGASDAATPRRAVVAAGERPVRSQLGAARRGGASERSGAATRLGGGKESDRSPGTQGGAPESGAAAAPPTCALRRSRRSRRTLPRPRRPRLRRSTLPFPAPACRRRSMTSAARFPTSTRRSRSPRPSCPWKCRTRRRLCPRSRRR